MERLRYPRWLGSGSPLSCCTSPAVAAHGRRLVFPSVGRCSAWLFMPMEEIRVSDMKKEKSRALPFLRFCQQLECAIRRTTPERRRGH